MPESKKYKAAIALFDREQQYTPTEAVSIVKKTASKKFDESVDIAVRLGVDPRKTSNAVRGVARSAPLMYLMPPVAGLLAWGLAYQRQA